MRCSVCTHNKGFCRVKEHFPTTEEEQQMVSDAWKRNNHADKCLFWRKGKMRDTHEEVGDAIDNEQLPNM